MPDPNARDAKLIQYLNEAYGKERQLETALQAHIAMTTRDAYKKKLKAHLKETKAHAKDVKARIKKLGGTADEVEMPGPDVLAGVVTKAQTVARKGAAAAQGPLHALRGTGEEEKLLKNAKTEYANEAEEIATYTAIQSLAEAVNDKETAQLAKRILREEERMASYLAKLIPTLTKSVATAEVPAAERRKPGARRSSAGRRTSTRRTPAKSPSAKRASAKSAATKSAATKSASAKSANTRSASTKRAGTKRSGTKRAPARRAATKRTTTRASRS